MAPRPQAIAFDVFDTLFATGPLQQALSGEGLPPLILELWLARTLRNGFALAASGSFRPFEAVARATLEGLFADREVTDAASKVARIVGLLRELQAHPDVGPALSRVRAAGIPAVAVTTDSTEAARQLLARAGLSGLVEGIISIDDVQQWKPRPEVYWHVARLLGVPAPRVAAVTAHDWDVHGAHRAGLTTGWVRRAESRTEAFAAANVSGDDLVDVCEQLLGLPD